MSADKRTEFPDPDTAVIRNVVHPYAELSIASGIGTQALFGQRFACTSVERGIAHGALLSILPQSTRVDYVGTLSDAALSDTPQSPTHRVSAVCSTVFKQADIKSKLIGALDRNAAVTGQVKGDFLQLRRSGYIHLSHLREINAVDTRPYHGVAADMLHRPYVWGGTGAVGVDCSGLVQSALAATGVDAPRDADQQEATLGCAVDAKARRAGDLIFWPGHVGIIVEDDQLLHANAHHMRVAVESYAEAIARIGVPRSVKRL